MFGESSWVPGGSMRAVTRRVCRWGWGSAAVGDRGVLPRGASPGDDHRAAGGAYGHRIGQGVAAAGAVVELDPLLGAGGGVVGDRGAEASRVPAEPGAVHRPHARTDAHRRGE